MGWTAPTDRSTGYVVTAADWNIVEDDLTFLGAMTGVQVATSETTTSATYADLATVGPAVTITTGANAIVMISAAMSNTGSNINLMSAAVSGATTLAASDANSAEVTTAGSVITGSCISVITGLNAGSNTFTAKYRTGGGTATFVRRWITVIPLP